MARPKKVVDSAQADDVPKPVVGATMRCWNCKNQKQSNRLNAEGICEVCGFNVNTVYNGGIEAARAAQRQADEAAFNKSVLTKG